MRTICAVVAILGFSALASAQEYRVGPTARGYAIVTRSALEKKVAKLGCPGSTFELEVGGEKLKFDSYDKCKDFETAMKWSSGKLYIVFGESREYSPNLYSYSDIAHPIISVEDYSNVSEEVLGEKPWDQGVQICFGRAEGATCKNYQ